MTRSLSHRPLVLGIHPTSHGFGWAVFENPVTLHSFGHYHQGPGKNASCLKRIAWLLERLEPEAVVLEAFDQKSSGRSERIRRLCLAVVTLAATHNAEITVFNRAHVQAFFARAGARTREEVASALAQSHPALRHHLPKKRRPWKSEPRRLAVFCAAALVLTHYENEATAFLDTRNAA